LKYVAAGEPLSTHLPDEPDCPDLREADTTIEVGLVAAFHHELVMVADRLERIRLKSLDGILNFQEQLVSEWSAASPVIPMGLDSGNERMAPQDSESPSARTGGPLQ